MNKLKNNIQSNRHLSWLQIFANWLMQGVFHADKSEKTYKILFTVLGWIVVFTILFFGFRISMTSSLIFGFLIAHTLNWVINCNLFILLVHRMRWLKTTKHKLFDHLESIQDRLERIPNKSWILYCVSHGSICKGEMGSHSDIDVSIIRRAGLNNLLRAIIFYVKEKKIADIKGVPLDIFICDTPKNCIDRSKGQKNPIVILDHESQVDVFYPDGLKINIEEAKLLNKVS